MATRTTTPKAPMDAQRRAAKAAKAAKPPAAANTPSWATNLWSLINELAEDQKPIAKMHYLRDAEALINQGVEAEKAAKKES